VITGIGIISSIGQTQDDVTEALKQGKSGIRFSQTYADLGFRTHVHGNIEIDLAAAIDRKLKRFMGDAAAFNYLAMRDAIADAKLSDEVVSHPRTGLIMGSGGGSPENQIDAADVLRNKSLKRVGPYRVPRTMSSTTSACLSTAFKIKGVNYTISSACSTSAHCIGNACEQIQLGKQDVMFAGGGEEVHWGMTVLFDAMGALSSKYNDRPDQASRPYDADRDGFVISGGGGVLVLESLEHAQVRGAHIYAEVVGYGATSDGYDMVQPSGEGAIRCMQQAMENVDAPIDYINAHGTSTPVGDMRELEAIQTVFADMDKKPYLASTKSLTGHALGAAGVNEAIYSLLMMKHNFIAASANVDTPDEKVGDYPLVTKRIDDVQLNTVMSNSFGFGGTNACLVMQRFKD